jgi:hypothetical protein
LERRGERQPKINSLANFVMLTSASNKRITDSAPSEYLPEIATAAGPNLPAWLASNLIPIEAFNAALSDDFDTFLALRSNYIHEAVIGKTGWKQDESSATAASIGSEDDDVTE